MIFITKDIAINENEICEEFIRSSGPGGQNVNKVATAVQLRFNVSESSLPDDVRQRLIFLAGRQITQDGVLIIHARRFRTQEGNRQDAMNRLIHLIQQAAERPKIRRKTKPTLASKMQRLKDKHQHGETKRQRSSVSLDEP
ncbi:MAG: alternative ribosome rescue aminoacyl-tRNA hydrolase ArfB [bacterium]|nr:alternative ribosome rescue aminoacyl-tRNA hydrolase ArfB [bacterium]